MAYQKRYNPDALPAHVEPEQVHLAFSGLMKSMTFANGVVRLLLSSHSLNLPAQHVPHPQNPHNRTRHPYPDLHQQMTAIDMGEHRPQVALDTVAAADG